ncbi:squalene/phytoene synthase family protein [Corallococcus sp. ZKHCc1 1396]|uniref:Squalene/phytoene synthase family protein n=1 Tax=Corallococcus soli TaxID=2710757 RepID=A0ABR9PJV5_9BACT|nr:MULTISPECIES: phytoene/squalene synthase family protein [Corallococcus]MBE4748189.1 squalene/phytoene synthase family protein [Corallococcus soli]MCY1033350.1 phytoene/squalene synthase family protein [Corallococcus sp. BB11-1]
MAVSGEAFCRTQLPRVSRTFALNIPLLPEPLDLAVTVAYLLCRIADTLEDEAPGALQQGLLDELAVLVELGPDWEARARAFARGAELALREEAPVAEAELLAGTPTVLETLASLPSWVHPHVARCVRTMTGGMKYIQRRYGGGGRVEGLPDLQATFMYCYYVAGVVGEMLTGLFIASSPRVAARQDALAPRALAFGRALQLTNILKDVREDLDRGSCWLPRDRMAAHGLEPGTLALPGHRARAVALMGELVRVARGELEVALEYALALPAGEPGLRLFCLYPLFFAVETLNTLEGNPAVFDPEPVKMGRESVLRVMLLTQERVASDEALRALYAQCSRMSSPEPVEVMT